MDAQSSAVPSPAAMVVSAADAVGNHTWRWRSWATSRRALAETAMPTAARPGVIRTSRPTRPGCLRRTGRRGWHHRRARADSSGPDRGEHAGHRHRRRDGRSGSSSCRRGSLTRRYRAGRAEPAGAALTARPGCPGTSSPASDPQGGTPPDRQPRPRGTRARARPVPRTRPRGHGRRGHLRRRRDVGDVQEAVVGDDEPAAGGGHLRGGPCQSFVRSSCLEQCLSAVRGMTEKSARSA